MRQRQRTMMMTRSGPGWLKRRWWIRGSLDDQKLSNDSARVALLLRPQTRFGVRDIWGSHTDNCPDGQDHLQPQRASTMPSNKHKFRLSGLLCSVFNCSELPLDDRSENGE
jgi:hypothetical protein